MISWVPASCPGKKLLAWEWGMGFIWGMGYLTDLKILLDILTSGYQVCLWD